MDYSQVNSQSSFTVHVYDLPKIEDIGNKLMIALHDKGGIILSDTPKIDRSPAKLLYTAIIEIDASSEE